MDKPILNIDMVAYRDKMAKLRNDANYSDNQSEVDDDQYEAWVHDNDPTYQEHPDPSGWIGDQF